MFNLLDYDLEKIKGLKMGIINILAIVVSPLVAVLITMWLNGRAEKRKEKMAVFKQLMVYRGAGTNNIGYVDILNSIDVIFSDSKKVKKAYQELFTAYGIPDTVHTWNNKQTKLIEAIAQDLGYKSLEWEKILNNVYYPTWLAERMKNEDKYLQGQLATAELAIKKVAPKPKLKKRK